MPWQCKLVEDEAAAVDPGALWFCPPSRIYVGAGDRLMAGPYILSDEYLRDWQGKRLPLFIWMPKGYAFCLDSAFSNREPPGPGWTVTGEAPQVTLSPSIHHVGIYHGWLQDGVLSDG